MWIFLTAVFLVLFFLFYRHPKEMLKVAGALLGALIVLGLGFYYWELQTADEQRALQQAGLQRWQEQERQLKLTEAEREQQAEAEKSRRALQLESRRQATVGRLNPVVTSVTCAGFGQCRFIVTIKNDSSETISDFSLGLVFIPKGQSCPSAIQTTTTERIVMQPGDTTVFDFYSGNQSEQTPVYCLIITGVNLADGTRVGPIPVQNFAAPQIAKPSEWTAPPPLPKPVER